MVKLAHFAFLVFCAAAVVSPDNCFALDELRVRFSSAPALKAPNPKRGAKAYNKLCYSCHVLPNRFVGLKKGALNAARKKIPEMKTLKISAQQSADLIKYFASVK